MLEYDDVLNKQREIIYRRRRRILKDNASEKKFDSLHDEIISAIYNEIGNLVRLHTELREKGKWDIKEVIENAQTILPESYKEEIEKIEPMKNTDKIIEYLKELVDKDYEAKEKAVGEENMRLIEKTLMLRSIDNLWIEHLTSMEELREGIGLRGYGQRDPLVEYKREAFNMFERLITSIYEEVIHLILKVELNKAPASESSTMGGSGVIMSGGDEMSAAGTFKEIRNPKSEIRKNDQNQNVASVRKVGRNEPCPCGSGKKYKKCCGR